MMVFWRTFFALAMSVSFVWAGPVEKLNSRERAIEFIRSFFDENADAPETVSKVIFVGENPELSALKALEQLQFQPKDIWGNRDYVFGYGLLADGSTLIFAWKASTEAADIELRELSSIYQDERMASIKDANDLKKWKTMREIVSGAFIGIRKSESKYASLFPYREAEQTGRESLRALALSSGPLVVRFRSTESKTKNVDHLPTR